MAGGLTGVQGFFIGVFAVILLFIGIGMLGKPSGAVVQQHRARLECPEMYL